MHVGKWRPTFIPGAIGHETLCGVIGSMPDCTTTENAVALFTFHVHQSPRIQVVLTSHYGLSYYAKLPTQGVF